jgi:hypothetical protein
MPDTTTPVYDELVEKLGDPAPADTGFAELYRTGMARLAELADGSQDPQTTPPMASAAAR